MALPNLQASPGTTRHASAGGIFSGPGLQLGRSPGIIHGVHVRLNQNLSMQTLRPAPVPLQLAACLFLGSLALAHPAVAAGTPKVHTVALGTVRKVPYTAPSATPSADAPKSPETLKVRPLVVDGRQKEWTTGDAHDVTDRSFTIRRALRLNDALPGESAQRWSWQPGPWLLVDRSTGHITALHLPDFDPLVSDAVWFRDYAAYCGTGPAAKGGLFVVVAQLGARRPIVQKPIGKWPIPDAPAAPCKPAEWQRGPLRVTMAATGAEPTTFDVVGAAALIEDGDSDE